MGELSGLADAPIRGQQPAGRRPRSEQVFGNPFVRRRVRVPGNWTASVSGEGTHNISCSISDKATNQTTKSVTVKIDTTAPTVIGLQPAATATDASRRTNVVATFSENMQKSTLTKANFKLYKVSATGPIQITNVTVTSNLAGTKATLNPYGFSATRLANNTRYKVVLTSRVEDLAANALGANKVWSFRTVR